MPCPAPRIDLDRFLSYRLSVISARWAAATGRFYRRRFGLALREWRVLAVLPSVGAAAVTDVVRRTAVDKAGVSRALASLQRRGLVQRLPSKQDARRAEVRLTARGRALLRRLAPAALARQAALKGAFSAAELRSFFALLDKLERRVSQLAG
jgi:DNA-binding MarR family transcriptional regulator